MWQARLRDNYGSLSSWLAYARTYGLAKRLGFQSAKAAWDANPLIQGSVNPKDFRVVNTGDNHAV